MAHLNKEAILAVVESHGEEVALKQFRGNGLTKESLAKLKGVKEEKPAAPKQEEKKAPAK